MTNENYTPATFGILSLAMAIQLAAEAYRSESILARVLKLAAPLGDYARCKVLFDSYAPALQADGLRCDRVTFEFMLRKKPPEDMLEVVPAELPGKWLFNPRRGWMEIESAAS